MMSLHTIEAPSMAAQHTSGVRRPSAPRTGFSAAKAALQWRLLLWWAILLLLPTFVASLPVWQMLGENLDHSAYAARLAERLDLIAVGDLLNSAHEHYASALGNGAVVALLLTLLLSPLLSSMSLAAARARDRLGFMALLASGAQGYARMLRVLLVALIPLGIAGALSGAAFHVAGKTAETAILESDALHASHVALAVSAVLMLLAHATVDSARALLGNDRRRRSAFLAWWHACRLLVRRPLAVLGVYLVVTVVGLAVALLLALARAHVPALGGAGTLGALVLGQLLVLVLGWTRNARLFALMAVARSHRI
jgi:hypothetical protein